jgi:uncharacterized protein YlxP (DUF503 family)
MNVASVVVWLNLIQCHTQRDKDSRVKRIMDKLRTHFNVSLAPLGPDDQTGVVALGIAAVARTKREAREVLERLLDAVAVHPDAQIVGEPEWR